MKTYIFDLDGVIVDTAKYHFLAWKNLAKNLGISFDEKTNERLKGVSRENSLEIILKLGNIELSKSEKEKLLQKKNSDYLSFVNDMDETGILAGVKPVLDFLKKKGNPVVLGSASKNAKTILEKVNLLNLFDVIVDGNQTTKAKPNPEVFLIGAKKTNTKPENCIVFEDSIAGIQAANSAKMISVGIGNKETLQEADYVFRNFSEIPFTFFNDLETK